MSYAHAEGFCGSYPVVAARLEDLFHPEDKQATKL